MNKLSILTSFICLKVVYEWILCWLQVKSLNYASHNLATIYHHLKISSLAADSEYNTNQCCCNFPFRFPFLVQSRSSVAKKRHTHCHQGLTWAHQVTWHFPDDSVIPQMADSPLTRNICPAGTRADQEWREQEPSRGICQMEHERFANCKIMWHHCCFVIILNATLTERRGGSN